MQEKYIKLNNLQVSNNLYEFVNTELLKDTNVSVEKFWNGLDKHVHELASTNKKLIEFRGILQKKIDGWHKERKGVEIDANEYLNFLKARVFQTIKC